MDRNDRERRDAAGIGPYARERERLTPLSSLDSWSVSEGEPDIRNWEIRTVSGRQLGIVADLLIDREASEVVLVDVDLPGSDRHTYVPIRVVQLDRTRRLVLMDSADLPESDLARADRTLEGRDVDAPGTVRYPQREREVAADRAILADSAPRADSGPLADRAPGSGESLAERRRADRRRIDRLSTDL
ncbi:MAG TPA: PRC-barrel domain-containing protein [Gemmatimonadaceae bacterium]|nr:PRC-barrel domain-containing protein [Gemmatimonadaceae bacterium]